VLVVKDPIGPGSRFKRFTSPTYNSHATPIKEVRFIEDHQIKPHTSLLMSRPA